MISICIPIFNSDVRKLAESLKIQAREIPAEIILIDDGSEEKYREVNRQLEQEGIRYYELKENIGRSRIRNRFAGIAAHSHLLFLDCDSVILSDDFLADYAREAKEHPDRIICGGRIYPARPPARKWRLHWTYGTRRESRPVQVRQQDPNRSFMTNNFLIPADVLKEIPFDERLSGYGHEDSLFGYELSCRGREILHIHNPVLHGQLESNRDFLKKTREAVQNLVRITELLEGDREFRDSITLLRTLRGLESGRSAGIIRTSAVLSLPLTGWLLRNGCISLKLLDAYKLGLLLKIRP